VNCRTDRRRVSVWVSDMPPIVSGGGRAPDGAEVGLVAGGAQTSSGMSHSTRDEEISVGHTASLHVDHATGPTGMLSVDTKTKKAPLSSLRAVLGGKEAGRRAPLKVVGPGAVAVHGFTGSRRVAERFGRGMAGGL